MYIASQIFNNQHCTAELIDLFDPTDFLKRSNKTLQHLFKNETNFIESRLKLKTFDARVYHKSEKK